LYLDCAQTSGIVFANHKLILPLLFIMSSITFPKPIFYSTIDLAGYSVFSGSLNDIDFSRKCVINTINQYSFVVAEKDADFRIALVSSDILLPDGVGVTGALKFLKKRSIKKIAGADLHKHLLEKLDNENGKCFYLGSSENTLGEIKERLKKEYPNIRVGFYSPPFKATFSDIDNEEMILAVNNFNPDVLFVGMTAPKQEKWIYQHKAELHAKAICAIGAVFDFYAGTVQRPSKFWQNIGLEWLMRLVAEPKRMYKRYLYFGPVYAGKILKLKFKGVSKIV
jgi:N-acetylglucosaminyldiphosphoundecaprenol N-acetyl-beta-D-mannosaminyltransferase